MRNEIPATNPIQNAGIKGAIAPPINALIPSTSAKARRAPRKTALGLCFALRLTTAICVLSPNSARATIANVDKRGSKSNAMSILPELLEAWTYPQSGAI